MTATTARAQFLLQQERFAITSDAAMWGRWGTDAGDVRQPSALALKADAESETVRQLALFGTPIAKDAVIIKGRHRGLVGRTVRVAYNGRLGIAGTADLFVSAAEVDDSGGSTTLKGWVRL